MTARLLTMVLPRLSARRVLVMCSLVAATAPGVSAHRLDELLIATRLAVSPGQIVAEVDLTPGAEIGSGIVATMDGDADGRISANEGETYARRVVQDLTLDVNGVPLVLKVVRSSFPPVETLREGLGTVRLEMAAATRAVRAGPYTLAYRNDHRADIGVYLVNALMPDARAVAITSQSRDEQQRGIQLEYSIAPRSPLARPASWLLVGGLAVCGVAGRVWRRRGAR